MLIKGYDHGPLTAGETLADRPGFWANHLLGWCEAGPDGVRPEPEWFGDDGADTDALAGVLYDERAWPVLRVPFGDGHRVVAVFRNLDGDPGLDFLLTHPGWACAETLLSYDGDRSGPGLHWRQLLHVAASVPDGGPGHGPDEGLSDPAARLLLLLPVLTDGPRHAAEAVPRIASALTAVGAPQETAALAARCLIGGTEDGIWHDPAWGSPLSGGGSRAGDGAGRPGSWPLPGLGVTAAEQERLARALGEYGEPSTAVSARST
ncbi:hypothetical protein OG539_37185 [Actinacidiphila glaucinigra]|uniref:hypothetical protein n=1 Tax=Actinacidiphila glaucinigra TaxID=235986 RepID=UPI002DD83B79|nr:hypothetical protein [Actinacidiphila glaucinigra]WSD58503.1 hypothetical protein OIE69_06085 [Actinacidiphila glaucinigra]